MSLFDHAMRRRAPPFACQWPTCGLEWPVFQMYASTSPKASASSGGMTNSRASRPTTSSREKPVARSHASLKNRIRPARSSTQMSDFVVSVRTLANSSPRTNPGVSVSAIAGVSDPEVEEGDVELLDPFARRAGCVHCEGGEPFGRLGAPAQRFFVCPERDDEGPASSPVLEPDHSAETGAVAQPGKDLIPNELEPP